LGISDVADVAAVALEISRFFFIADDLACYLCYSYQFCCSCFVLVLLMVMQLFI